MAARKPASPPARQAARRPATETVAVSQLVDGQPVEVRRCPRRRRTVSAYREAGRIVVLLPARTSRREEARWVSELVGKILAREQRPGRCDSDSQLLARAKTLSRDYLGGRAEPVSVRWVASMRTRWASCTPADRSIRVSERLRPLPAWVLDYVLVHELAHLIEPAHNQRFWSLVAGYPRTEKARGFLEGVTVATGWAISDDGAGGLEQ